MTKLVTMTPDRTQVVPAEARRALELEGETQFELEVTVGTLILRPASPSTSAADEIPEEDRWAYAPEHVERLERALSERRGRRATERELDRLMSGRRE